MKSLLSFTHPYVVPNPYDILSSMKHKMICFKECTWLLFHIINIMKVKALPEFMKEVGLSELWANHFKSDLFSELVEVQKQLTDSWLQLTDQWSAHSSMKGKVFSEWWLRFWIFRFLPRTWNIGKQYGPPLWCFYVTPLLINCKMHENEQLVHSLKMSYCVFYG